MASKTTNINLEVNGRILIPFILHNFKKYKIPKLVRKDGEDPCNEIRNNKLEIYQEFIGKFLDPRTGFMDLILYFGVGAGKTVTIINLYNILYNYSPKINFFILIPAMLHNNPWLDELNKWLAEENKKGRLKNIEFIHYDSPYADKDFLEKMKKADSSNLAFFVIDEAHRFIGNVYNNIVAKSGKRAQTIYDYIQQEKKDNPKTRIMLLSATPMVNTPYEFALMVNLLRPGSFPPNENEFDQIYISSTNFASLDINKKNMFQRRIMGLVSYYIGATPDKYPSSQVHYKSILMQKYQLEVYEHFEKIEEKKELMNAKFSRGKVGQKTSTYNSYTRQSSNFVFPLINDKINGINRPRPYHFKLQDFNTTIIEEGKNKKKIYKLLQNKEYIEYKKAIDNYIKELKIYLDKIHSNDKKNNHTLSNDIKYWKTECNGSLTEFLKIKKKSELFNTLMTCGPKFITCIFNIIKSKGPVLVYSNYVEMEGLQIFKIYLHYFGYAGYEELDNNKYDFKRYIDYHGGIDKDIRVANRIKFNDASNNYGKIYKIILISPAGAEGITLNNGRQVHILEPYWNEARIKQIIGRMNRFCVHKDIPVEERHIDIFRYKMTRKNEKETADEKMEYISRKKENLLLSFDEAIKEVAIDCELFKEHNMLGISYKCFQFNEDNYFQKNVGPAYNIKNDYDEKLDNGSNASNSINKTIKVRKIQAVKKLDSNTYSLAEEYWYYDKTNVVYSLEPHYPIGKLELDENHLPIQLESNIYIISYLVNIPEYNIY